jgi:hypothetical protein
MQISHSGAIRDVEQRKRDDRIGDLEKERTAPILLGGKLLARRGFSDERRLGMWRHSCERREEPECGITSITLTYIKDVFETGIKLQAPSDLLMPHCGIL